MRLERIVIVKNKNAILTSDYLQEVKYQNKKYMIPEINPNGWVTNLILAYIFYKFENIDDFKVANSFVITFKYINDNVSGFSIMNKYAGAFNYNFIDYGFDFIDDENIYIEDIEKIIIDIQKDFHIKSICPCKWYQQTIDFNDKGNIIITANKNAENTDKIYVPNYF